MERRGPPHSRMSLAFITIQALKALDKEGLSGMGLSAMHQWTNHGVTLLCSCSHPMTRSLLQMTGAAGSGA